MPYPYHNLTADLPDNNKIFQSERDVLRRTGRASMPLRRKVGWLKSALSKILG